MSKRLIFIIIIALILLLSLAAVMFKQEYRPAKWDGDKCLTYYKDCTCFGLLRTLESYPAQYNCQGVSFCEDINITECD